MKTYKVIKHLRKKLKNDPGYYEAWKANIAMAYVDNYIWYKARTKKNFINAHDRHLIANEAAEYFMKQLMD